MDLIQGIIEGMQGPGKFRFLVQPAIAILLGLRDGRPGLKTKRHSYHLAGIKKPFILAWLMDTLFQLIILQKWNPFEALIVGFVLVVIPYMLTKGVTKRVSTRIRAES